VSQSGSLLPLHSSNDFQPFWGNLWAPPLSFRRRPPQSNCRRGASARWPQRRQVDLPAIKVRREVESILNHW